MASRIFLSSLAAVALVQAASVRDTATSTAANILSVTGQGSVDIPTSETVVSASVTKTTPCNKDKPNECSGQPAQEEASAAMQEVIDYLKEADGVSEVTTSNLALQPTYDYGGSKPVLTDYKATSSITFHVDNDQASAVLQGIIENGITTIDSVTFVASDEAVAKAQDEALKKAVTDAQKQADAVLEAVGSSQTGIVGIQVGSAAPPLPVPMAASSGGMDVAAEKAVPPPIEASTQTVSASVTLNIKYD